MNNPLIELNNVSKTFYCPLTWRQLFRLNFKKEKPIHALKNVTLEFESGKITGILGPNGAGKSTLLKCISTLILPDQGEISVCGHDIKKHDNKIKSMLGLLSAEERSFYWRLTGLQNLQFYCSLYGINSANAKARIEELFKIFRIDYQNKRFDSYSTGMKRKFSLIRALLHDPDILLLDEPTKSLDFSTALELKNMIKTLASEGKTILYATHDINDAQNSCDEFVVLHKGKVLARGPLEQLRNSVKSKIGNLSEIYLELIKNDT